MGLKNESQTISVEIRDMQLTKSIECQAHGKCAGGHDDLRLGKFDNAQNQK